jgi:hypothetical protein
MRLDGRSRPHRPVDDVRGRSAPPSSGLPASEDHESAIRTFHGERINEMRTELLVASGEGSARISRGTMAAMEHVLTGLRVLV